MADWALAWALQGVASATALRERLAGDILASANEDGSFGTVRRTAVHGPGHPGADLAGRGGRDRAPGAPASGRHDAGRLLAAVRPVLLRRKDLRGASCPTAVLARLMLGESHRQLLWLDGGVYAVSLFVDGYHIISSALASLALTPSDLPPSTRSSNAPMQGREAVIPDTAVRTTSPTSRATRYLLSSRPLVTPRVDSSRRRALARRPRPALTPPGRRIQNASHKAGTGCARYRRAAN